MQNSGYKKDGDDIKSALPFTLKKLLKKLYSI